MRIFLLKISFYFKENLRIKLSETKSLVGINIKKIACK
jgi:hypothetical protein